MDYCFEKHDIVMLKYEHQNLVCGVLNHIYDRLVLYASFEILYICVKDSWQLIQYTDKQRCDRIEGPLHQV